MMRQSRRLEGHAFWELAFKTTPDLQWLVVASLT